MIAGTVSQPPSQDVILWSVWQVTAVTLHIYFEVSEIYKHITLPTDLAATSRLALHLTAPHRMMGELMVYVCVCVHSINVMPYQSS